MVYPPVLAGDAERGTGMRVINPVITLDRHVAHAEFLAGRHSYLKRSAVIGVCAIVPGIVNYYSLIHPGALQGNSLGDASGYITIPYGCSRGNHNRVTVAGCFYGSPYGADIH